DLLATLETEKERRWQAEQAARKMAELLKKAQARGQESEAMKSSAIEATSQLKQAVMNEHEANVVLKEEIFALQWVTFEMFRNGDFSSSGNLRGTRDPSVKISGHSLNCV
ncbi:leucine-rich repeat and coiled-coil domain-containing protein 1, partial [Biomphalaria glabrata]